MDFPPARPECDDFLARLAEGDPVVGMALRHALANFWPQPTASAVVSARWENALRARQLKNRKQRWPKNTVKAHREMKALAKTRTQVWQEVDRVLENGQKKLRSTNKLPESEEPPRFSEFRTPEISSNPCKSTGENMPIDLVDQRWKQQAGIGLFHDLRYSSIALRVVYQTRPFLTAPIRQKRQQNEIFLRNGRPFALLLKRSIHPQVGGAVAGVSFQ